MNNQSNNQVSCSDDLEQHSAKEKVLNIVVDKLAEVFNSRPHDSEVRTLYHYTTIEALTSGILQRGKPEEAICLFATDTRCMNDNKEIETGKEWLKELMNSSVGDKGRLISAITRFDAIKKMFSISLSENQDMMPMWSTYGNKGDGISLGFDREILNRTLCNIIPCIYNKETFENCFNSLFNSLLEGRNSNNLVGEMQMLVLCEVILIGQCKNSEFEYEKEYRHLLLPDCKPSYRCKNNKIIPYHKVFLPKEALKQIVIGPNINSDLTVSLVKEYVEDMGFDDVEIKKSKSPFRNL